MEALTGASIAALTIYDMCKAVCKNMVIGDIKLVQKTGGKSDFNLCQKQNHIHCSILRYYNEVIPDTFFLGSR